MNHQSVKRFESSSGHTPGRRARTGSNLLQRLSAALIKITFFEKFFQEYHQTVTQFGSRSDPGPNCLQRLSSGTFYCCWMEINSCYSSNYCLSYTCVPSRHLLGMSLLSFNSSLLVSSAENLYKQLGPRSGLT